MTDRQSIKAAGPLIAIVGQTASGKSDLAMRAAIELGSEIIAADSWTVRKKLDIGTAKPTLDIQRKVPHHLLDIVEPCADFTAVEFQRQAQRAIHDIQARSNVPLIVGGTGLYIDSVLYDYTFSPKSTDSERQRYNAMSREELLMEAEAKMLDASSIDTRNKRRIIRLLETGGHQPSRQLFLRPNTLVVGLSIGKQQLHQRIEQRVDTMLEAGLEQEVANLAQAYGWDCEGLKGIGYREWRDYFVGNQSLEQTRFRIIQATKQLAKRQHTWFKRSEDIDWCANVDEALQKMYAFLQKS